MTEQPVLQPPVQDGAPAWSHSDAEALQGVGAGLPPADSAHQDRPGRRKPALVRSKTFDHSLLSQIQSDARAKMDRKKPHYSQLSKTNSQFHKTFSEICKEELLRQSYTCALQKDILYQGRLFVSDNWICFHSKVFGRDTKIAIPVLSVTHIKKTKTAILVPNALVIATSSDRHAFVSFMSRDNTYKFLMSICLHLEERSPGGSPVPSTENSFRSQRSPASTHFPLSFPGDSSDLDGPVGRRRQDLEESSSSDSQTPDDDKLAEFPVPSFREVLKHGGVAPDPEHATRNQNLQKNQNQNQNRNPGAKQPDPLCVGSCETADLLVDGQILKPVSLNKLLYVYLFLVCVLVLSSCFMTFRIISLEQTLNTLGSMTDFTRLNPLRGSSEHNAELYSELTLNLMKLEKVQKNLQKLLDEAA